MKSVIAALTVSIGLTSCGGTQQAGTASPSSATAAASQAAAYPPKTVADLKALASTGEDSAVHEVKSERTGLAPCLQPKLPCSCPHPPRMRNGLRLTCSDTLRASF